ncbi:hypothetical protein FHS25_005158 [Rhizobium laguerreae]|uniref:Uncharacterized protein n=1 Tax=Rhizobium laguerreae TaxID=1076926 RepID=A0ABR6GEE1_9HYPH|nr:hypothetical protein [Rhizobium laguerreae]MBB3164655.1 hypothetical protein [Rhizobium laguerreae]OOO46428.1 hypothetical protein BS630_25595 [Rhizobium laguerreae]
MPTSFQIPPIDAWTASSLMQKAIRRGEVEYAEAAALAFHRMRGNSIWRRLTLISFEDIGPADPSLCTLVTELSINISARRQIGSDQETIIFLVRKMCAAAKNREADYLICAAKQAPFNEPIRSLMAGRSLSERIAIAIDPDAPLLNRAVAAWMASGINGGGPVVLSRGDMSGLMQNFTRASNTHAFINAVVYACAKTSEPIVLMAPLLALASGERSEVASIIEEPLPPSLMCAGLPSWTFDKHTRLGKSAIRQLLVQDQPFRDCIADFVPEYRSLETAAMAAFYADAISVKRRAAWSLSSELYALGLRTDMTKIGVPENGVEPIVSAMNCALEHLNDIRQRLRITATCRFTWHAEELETGQCPS